MKSTYRIRPGAPGLVSICRSLADQEIPYRVVLERHDSWGACIRISASGKSKPAKIRKPTVLTAPKRSAPKPLEAEVAARHLKKALEALANVRTSLRDAIHRNWHESRWDHPGSTYQYDAERFTRSQRIGRAIARIFARHGTKSPYRLTKIDYADLDAVVGGPVLRESKLGSHWSNYFDYVIRTHAQGRGFSMRKARFVDSPAKKPEAKNLGFVGCKPFYAPTFDEQHHWGEHHNPIQEFLAARADVEYWQEIVRLIGERKAA